MFEGLVTAVSATYEQQRSNGSEIAQFRVGDKWTAYVQPTGDFIVRNETRRTICRGNLHTGEETVPLPVDAAAELGRMLVEKGRVPTRVPEKVFNDHYFPNTTNTELA